MKRKALARQLSSLFLAATLVFSGVTPALAETAEEISAASVQEEETAIPEVVADETVDSAEPDHAEAVIPETGEAEAGPQESAGEETETVTEVEETIEDETEEATAQEEAQASKEPDLDIQYKDGKENVVVILAKNLTKADPSESISVAVWSEKDGQDDLKWYEMSYSSKDNAYKAEVKIADHKTIGMYHVHLYYRNKKNVLKCVDMDEFEIHGVEAEKLEVTDINKDKGTAVVTLSGVTCPSDVTRVQFPIWCKSDQSDLVWYEGKKVSDGVYQVTLDVSKHSYHYGTYIIHTYGTSGIGVRNYITGTTCTMKKGEMSLTAEPSDSGYTVKAMNLNTSGVKEVVFPIWSEKNGQDDLTWYTAKITAAGTATLNWNPTETGNYLIHCYTKDSAGKMTFQKGIEVNVAGPTIESMTVKTDNTKGSFKITVKGLTSPKSIAKVVIPVWTDANQKDLVWYTAVKQSDGSYTVSSDISKHGNRTGTYNAHLYVEDKNGKLTFVERETFTIKGGVDSLTAELSEDQSKCLLSANGIVSPQALDYVEFAVWSEENGQDDLKWYSASLNAGAASYNMSIENHKTAGLYHVHLYGVTKSGSKIFLDQTSFEVVVDVTAKVTISNKDEAKATFKVKTTLEGSSAVKSVRVAVWCDKNQKDLLWYDATKGSTGAWTITVEAAKHNYNFGTYNINVYAKTATGVEVKVAERTCALNLTDYLCVVNKGSGHRQVMLKNPSVSYSKVVFPTWSDANDQDDLVWYQAVKQSDGSWVADIYSSLHKDPGSYTIHCYADDTYIGPLTTSFAANEMRSIGEQKVEQYVNEILAVTGSDLRKVYLWCVNHINYETLAIPMPYPEGTTRQQYYFIYAYEHRTGNCFCYAATFYYCARALGYDARLIEGRYLRSDGRHGIHGWVEIYQNGIAYVCDPEIAWQSMLYDTYMRPYGSTPLTYFRNEAAY